MINKATFTNFRGFQHLELSELRTISLISGKNNSGKSSVLEGIFLALGYKMPDSFVVLNDVRGLPVTMSPAVLWEPLFYNLQKDKNIKLNLGIDDRELKVSYSWDDTFMPSSSLLEKSGQFISSDASIHSLKFDCRSGENFETGHFVMGPQGISRSTGGTKKPFVSVPVVQYLHSSRGYKNNL